MPSIDDPAFLAWYVTTLRDFPSGVATVPIAARACGVTRQAIRHAIKTSKLRVRSWTRGDDAVHLVPLSDLMTWHCERRRELPRFIENYDDYFRWFARTQGRTIVRVGDMLLCEVCRESAQAVHLLGGKTSKVLDAPE